MRRAVWPDHAVDAEILVVGLVAVVAAIGPIFAVHVVEIEQALVDPVPNESALQAGQVFKSLPVFLQIAVGVAHGVGVFAADERAVVL